MTRAAPLFPLPLIVAIVACSAPDLSIPARPVTDSEEVRWNGLAVRPTGTPDNLSLLFSRAGTVVHRERDPRAQDWGLFPPRDLDGDGADDLHAWFWSGGAHCCITHLVYSGTMTGDPVSPTVAWRLEQGDGDPIGFETVPGHSRPVLAVPDSSSAYVSGAFADTPMFPYFVEATPSGLRLAGALMQSAEPGGGPAILRDGATARAAFVRAAFGSEIAQTGRIPSAAERIRVLRGRLDTLLAAKAPGVSAADALAGADLLPDVERHIKLYCVYDSACDIPALAAEIEGSRPGVLGAWTSELDESWRKSPLFALKRSAR
ncbi:hypothetical protein [Allosphingosinicella deserti]|uniref:Uncharacterized protein n=1 Tax=Allosphingosinicella deserti TaxID=2116704 RepID=A0A2P7QS88_9SPHN|nr:hypothetical protein [Sphingomonas deserti]PSJ40819.1 hypothetical protein C7I55_11060 [Sphingomonas deserti]